ncbi:MAG: DUF349 domain-containing protein [Actinomycetota bacterium]|nr:MAG: DUF349 domain-containing protein [Actinomycetota bacterium]
MSQPTPTGPWGRVDADGTVYVVLPDGGERAVGQWAAGDPAAGLAFFSRKYDDLAVEIDLATRRLRDGKATPDQAAAVAARIRAALAEPAVVGDLAGLLARIGELDAAVAERRLTVRAERTRARNEAVAVREGLVAEAEQLAESTSWKATGERFREMLDQWRAAPRADRAKEQELWKRFSHARSGFDKRRRQHFAALDASRKEALGAKEKLVATAESLAESTDWSATSQAYRDLMAQWKAAPRGSRADEDQLWTRFRAAQDTFFAARSAKLDERDSGLRDNLQRREELLTEAEALLPVTDIRGAKAALRRIQEQWEAAGPVPRADRDRVEARLRTVEQAVRRSEAHEWRRTDPAARARAEDTVEMFRGSVAKLERALEAAQAAGDTGGAADAARSLTSTQALLAAAQRALDEFSA